MLSQFGVTIVTTGLSVILARSLGAKKFGVFSGFVGLSQALSLAVDLGLATWLLRELSEVWQRDPPESAAVVAGEMLRDALRVNARLGAFLAIGTAVVASVAGLATDLVALAVGLMTYVVLIAMSTALESGLRARRRVRTVVLTNAAEKLMLLAAVVVVLELSLGLPGLAVAYVIAGLLRVSLDYLFTLRGEPRLRGHRRASILDTIRACAPFALNAAAVVLVPRLDLPLVALISATSAGYFAIGFQVFTTIVIIPVIGATTLYPFVARRSERISMQRVAVGFGLLGALIAVAAIALSPLVLPLLFGPGYHRAIHVTQIILLALPLVFYGNGLLVGAYSDGRERALLLRTLPGAFLGSAAVIAGQLSLGTAGAAAGFDLRYVFIVIALLSLRRRPSAEPDTQASASTNPATGSLAGPSDQ